jgi:hypothetical protein
MMSHSPFLVALLSGGALLFGPNPVQEDPRAQVERAFQEQGIQVNIADRRCSFPVDICVRQDLLEYVLVTETGAAHESLLSTPVVPSVLNTALVTLGAKKGENVRWVEKNPPPSEEQIRNGAATYDVLPPTGETFFMYLAWAQDGETYFYRLEDLITNLERGRAMRRHGWVYLGSRMVQPKPTEPTEVLAADLEGNLINLSYFRAGNTLFTACLDDCLKQTIWAPNAPLLPPTASRLTMIFSHDRLNALPDDLRDGLVDVPAE